MFLRITLRRPLNVKREIKASGFSVSCNLFVAASEINNCLEKDVFFEEGAVE